MCRDTAEPSSTPFVHHTVTTMLSCVREPEAVEEFPTVAWLSSWKQIHKTVDQTETILHACSCIHQMTSIKLQNALFKYIFSEIFSKTYLIVEGCCRRLSHSSQTQNSTASSAELFASNSFQVRLSENVCDFCLISKFCSFLVIVIC